MTNRTNRKESRRVSAIVWAFLATSFFLLGSMFSAERAYAEPGDDMISAGLTQHKNTNYAQAIAQFENYIRTYPNGRSRNQAELFAGHSYMLRNEYTTTQDASAAQRHFNYILNQGSAATYYKEALFHTGHLAYDMRNYVNARDYLNQFIQAYPNDALTPFAYYYLANTETKLGNLQGAVAAYERALDIDNSPNSAIHWNCLLERAIAIGKLGDYANAEAELDKLDRTQGVPVDVAGQVAVQRALLKFVQQNYQQAINILEAFVRKAQSGSPNSNAPDLVAAVQAAKLYEAYAYYALKDYNQAIGIVEDTFERSGNLLPPAAALLKIKLLVATKRLNDAQALLNNLERSDYGRNNPDVVVSYRALITLMQGNYDAVIDSLSRMLDVRTRGGYTSSSRYPSPQNYGTNNYGVPTTNNSYSYGGTPSTYANGGTAGSNYNNVQSNYGPSTNSYNNGTTNNSYYPSGNPLTVEIVYFTKVGGQNLEPIDCVEAVGILILAHASRYAQSRAQQDYDLQDAIYRELVNFAAWSKEPTIDMLVKAIDRRRQTALQTPIAAANDPTYIVTPYVYNNYNATPGQFNDPTKPSFDRPDYYVYGASNNYNDYRPQNYYTSAEYQWGNPYTNNDYHGGNQSNYPNNNNNNANNNARPNNVPSGQQNQQNPNNGPNGQQNQQNQNNGPNGQQNQQNQNNGPNGQQNQQQSNNGPNGQQNQQQPNNGPNGQQNQQNQNNAPNGQQNLQQPNNVPNGQPNNDLNALQNQQQPEEEQHITPTEAQRALDKAETFFRNQEFSRCNETLLEALLSSESFWKDVPAIAPKIALLRGNALVMLGKSSEAQMSYQDVLNNAPGTPEATMAATFIGLNYDRLVRHEEAVRYLRIATASGATTPFSDAAYYYLGMNERERGNVEFAKQAFLRINRDYPDSSYWSHATWALAQIEADERDDKVAERLVNEALGNKPDAAIIDYLLFLKGEIALRAKDYEKALIAFDMIVDQYPDSELYAKARNRIAAIPEKYRIMEEEILEELDDYETLNLQQRPAQRPAQQVAAPRPQTAAPRPVAPRTNNALDQYDAESYRRPTRETGLSNASSENPRSSGSLPKATAGKTPTKESSTSSSSSKPSSSSGSRTSTRSSSK